MKTVVMTDTGSADVLALTETPTPSPGPGQVLVRVAAAGVNFMDIGVRRGGAWSDMANPKPLGVEGAGRVIEVGDGVSGLGVGQRVAWVYAPGSYADHVV
ncbi:MAG: alcohol dehydrogenase catalytic domain-containing protein, partial [Caulobacter sp.]